MTRRETGIIMDILATAYPRFYAGQDAPDPAKAVALWAEMFAEDDVALVAAAVKALIAADDKGFPPHIGAVKAKLRQITGARRELSESEAWNLIAAAVRNSGYEAAQEFAKLPPVLQRIVGSPATLREWAGMDSETLHSVVASNVQRSYKAISARERELEMLPGDVRQIVQQLAVKSGTQEQPALPPRYESQETALAKLEAERRAGWQSTQKEEADRQRTREQIIAELRREI